MTMHPRFLTILSLAFLCSSSLFAQTEPAVTHEIGADASIGSSTWLPSQGNQVDLLSPSWYAAGALQYNALFFNQHLNLGLGVGCQYKSWQTTFVYTNDQGEPVGEGIWRLSERTLYFPIEIGYRSQSDGRHNFLVDLLCISTYLLSRDQYDSYVERRLAWELPASSSRFGLDLGLQIGYRLTLSERLHLQVSVASTYDPFLADANDVQFYTLALKTGVRYTL